MDPEKPETNMGLKNMSDFIELCFIKTMPNVILKILKTCSLKVHGLTDL